MKEGHQDHHVHTETRVWASAGAKFHLDFFVPIRPWWASLVAQTVKNLPAMQETLVRSQEDPWQREWLPSPVFLSGEFHGQRNLVGYSPRGHEESDTTERLTHTHALWLNLQVCGLSINDSLLFRLILCKTNIYWMPPWARYCSVN